MIEVVFRLAGIKRKGPCKDGSNPKTIENPPGFLFMQLMPRGFLGVLCGEILRGWGKQRR
jgi:hypothetical protein